MVLKGRFAAFVGAAMLAWSGSSVADEYRPGDFLTLDLPQAVLSPKRLAPPARFEPGPVEAKADSAPVAAQAKTAAATVVTTIPVRTAKRHAAVRTKFAHRHTNPLDAQAFDTRIQVWPCKSGGICNWRRQGN
jgi:hypothetical protein